MAGPWEAYQQRGPWEAYQESSGKTRQWADVPGEAIGNLPASAGNFASGIYQAVRHPLDTASGLLDAAAGGLRNALPGAVVNAVEGGKPSESALRASQTADAIGQFYKGRYGSAEGLKNTLATDPVGVAADLSTVLTGGAGVASKAPAVASALQKGANLTNPLSVVAPAARAVGTAGKNLLGLTTWTGAEAVATAAKSGFQGKRAFWDNMAGNVPMTAVLDDAKMAVQKMGQDKAAAYRQGMAGVSADKSVLNFGGIDKAISDAAGISTYKGQIKNPKAAQVTQDIANEVERWKTLDPAQFHTPEGMDALKQRIGGMMESLPYEEKTARLAAGKIYNAVKGEITQQAPSYANTMKAYSEASELITEIERALSINHKAAADTSMRKLQSLMRNNVNTNYGNRLSLARKLEEQGGRELMPALAGQAMNSWVARGLGGQAENLATLGASAVHTPALALLPFQSPKAVGATLYGGGRAAGLLGDALVAMGATPQRTLTGALLAEQLGRERTTGR